MRNLYFTILIALLIGACAQPVTPSRFMDAVVECSNKNADASLVANVTNCLTGAVAGGYMQCLNLLPYAVDEIVCVVAELSQKTAKAINSGIGDAYDEQILTNANAFLKANRISRK